MYAIGRRKDSTTKWNHQGKSKYSERIMHPNHSMRCKQSERIKNTVASIFRREVRRKAEDGVERRRTFRVLEARIFSPFGVPCRRLTSSMIDALEKKLIFEWKKHRILKGGLSVRDPHDVWNPLPQYELRYCVNQLLGGNTSTIFALSLLEPIIIWYAHHFEGSIQSGLWKN